MTDYVPPTADEIRRVEEYHKRTKAVACKHDGTVTFETAGASCDLCGHRLRFISDLQIEEAKGLAPESELRDRLQRAYQALSQRGFVVAWLDGRRYDIRAFARGGSADMTPVQCITLEQVGWLLEADTIGDW